MKTIQSQWNDLTNSFGYSLRLSFSRVYSNQVFNDCVNYLHDIKKGVDATTHCFYMGNKHIYVFYEDTIKSRNDVKKQVLNHLRCGNHKLSATDYTLKVDHLDEMEGIDGFNDWLRELLSKSDEKVYTKSTKLTKDFMYDFQKHNRDQIGRIKVEKQIEQVEKELTVLEAEDAQADHEESELDKSLAETNDRLSELNKMKEKYAKLLETCKQKRDALQEKQTVVKDKKELDNKLKAEEMDKQQEVERLKKAAIESAICELFRFKCKSPGGHLQYLSKKVVCDLLGLDCTSQKDIRYLSNILKEYGVVYDRFKTKAKVKGCFIYITLR